MRALPAVVLAAAVAGAGCECLGPNVDGNGIDGGGGVCAYDTFDSPLGAGTATVGTLPLTCPVGTTAGMETEGFICPGGDDDWYRFSVPAGDDILVVRLRNTTPLTNVDLAYTVYGPDGMTVVPNAIDSDPNGADGITCFTYSYLVTPGMDHYVAVRDEDIGAGEADDGNSYLLALATAVDGDPYERNDDAASATSVTPGAMLSGAMIAYKADEDWYAFTAGPTDAVQIDLATSAASPVDLHFRLQDSTGLVFAEGGDPNGSDGPTTFSELRGLLGAGTYYLIVTDEGELESDLAMTYSVSIALVPNLDSNEPNNGPTTATPIATWSGGGLVTGSDTGRLFTPGDVDWFVVSSGGAGSRGVLEVTVNAGAGIPVLVAIVAMDPSTPCASGSGTCTNLSTLCPYTVDPDDFEWLDCPSFVCDMTPEPDACGGAGECLTGPGGSGCGYVQVVRGPGTVVSTAQPLFPTGAPTYIRVSAAMPGAFDLSNDYSISVSVTAEPDGGEPDSYYFPNLVQTQFGLEHDEIYEEMLARSFGIADGVGARAVALGAPNTGYISYEGDVDVWVLPDPCPAQDCGYTISYNFPGGEVEYNFFAHRSPSSLNCSFGDASEPMGTRSPNGPDAGTFGAPSDCCWFSVTEGGPYHLVVRDRNFNDWDYGAPYSFTITSWGVGAACTPPATPGTCSDPAPFCSGGTSSNPCCPSGCCGLAYAEGCGCF